MYRNSTIGFKLSLLNTGGSPVATSGYSRTEGSSRGSRTVSKQYRTELKITEVDEKFGLVKGNVIGKYNFDGKIFNS